MSLKAGEIVAKIYDALLTQYINPNVAESLASLNKLCVRFIPESILLFKATH